MINLSFQNTRLPRANRGSLANLPLLFILLLISILFGLLTYYTPLLLDDYTFTGNWRDDAANSGVTLDGMLRYYVFIRGYDNGRIANFLIPFSTVVPPFKTIFPWATGLCVAFMIMMVQDFSTGRQSLPFLSLSWLLTAGLLPWFDTIFVASYALNYVWASAVTLLFLYLLQRGERENWPPLIFLCILPLAIIAGGWHEAFATATLCGLSLLILVRRFRFSAPFYSVVGLYLVATLLFALSPGMIARFTRTVAEPFHPPLRKLFFILILLAAAILALLCFKSGRSALRKTLGQSVAIVSIGIIISGYLIGLVTANTPRCYFWPILAAIVLFLRVVFNFTRAVGAGGAGRLFSGRLLIPAATIMIFILCTVQAISAISAEYDYYVEEKEIIARLDKSDSGTVFYDFRTRRSPQELSRLTGGMTTAGVWHNPLHYRALWSYHIRPGMGIVPTSLRNASLSGGTPVVSNVKGAVLYNGSLISPAEDFKSRNSLYLPQEEENYFIINSQGSPREIRGRMMAVPFVTERGDSLVYYDVII